MIDIKTLRRVARTKGLTNMGYAEKDYFQEVLLLAVSREAPELVFKGGTALYKLHGLDRFSEDLDFTGEIGENETKRILSYLEDYGYGAGVDSKGTRHGTLMTFQVKGFLYQGTNQTLARVQMDVMGASDVVLDPEWRVMFPLYPDIPSFRLRTLALPEIFSEKVRSMLVRAKARDAYDVWFLLGKGLEPDLALIEGKLELNELTFGEELLEESLAKCRERWINELHPMVPGAVAFDQVEKDIRKGLLSPLI